MQERTTIGEYRHAGTVIRYEQLRPSGLVELQLWPAERENDLVVKREAVDSLPARKLPEAWQPVPARDGDSLVQVKVRGEPDPHGFTAGESMMRGLQYHNLSLEEHTLSEKEDGFVVETTLRHPSGLRLVHRLSTAGASGAFLVETEACNDSGTPLTLELLSSFCLGGLSPFAETDGLGHLFRHRFRSQWCHEGLHDRASLESLALEPSWSGHGQRSERFGQCGSMPVRGWFPWIGLEDAEARVFWGARLAVPASWQMECFRRRDNVSLSGGLADREFGQWWKPIAPGGCFTAPPAWIATATGTLEDLSDRLTGVLEEGREPTGFSEGGLPPIFNEWCTSWGNPTAASVGGDAAALQGTRCRYFVIDDGWSARERPLPQQNGDWRVDSEKFPDGLKAVADDLRAKGLIPGIWFEFEVCNEGNPAFTLTDHQLQRDGHVLQVGDRRFWDFRDPWTFDYLREKMIGLIRECGFRYLKVDYNDSIGIGCDGAEGNSPAEGLRQHLEGVQRFFREIRAAVPGIVIENCSSGGHRLEPSFLALTDLSSFSDAHECEEIPYIAALQHRLIPAHRLLVWAVLHPDDSLRRLRYSLASLFLGHPCLSGEWSALPAEAREEVDRALAFHEGIVPLLINGSTRVYREGPDRFNKPEGWQVVRRLSADGKSVLLVIHRFGGKLERNGLDLPLPGGDWSVRDRYNGDAIGVETLSSGLRLSLPAEPFTAAALVLTTGRA